MIVLNFGIRIFWRKVCGEHLMTHCKFEKNIMKYFYFLEFKKWECKCKKKEKNLIHFQFISGIEFLLRTWFIVFEKLLACISNIIDVSAFPILLNLKYRFHHRSQNLISMSVFLNLKPNCIFFYFHMAWFFIYKTIEIG